MCSQLIFAFSFYPEEQEKEEYTSTRWILEDFKNSCLQAHESYSDHSQENLVENGHYAKIGGQLSTI